MVSNNIVLLIAPSPAIVGGHSVQAAKLVEILGPVSTLQLRFLPIDPAVPTWLQWMRRIPGLRTVLMLILYGVGLFREVPKCDVLHVFTAGLSSYTLWTVPALFLSRLFRKRFVMHYHDGQAEQHLREWRSAAPTIALADKLIVPSGFLEDTFARFGIHADVLSNIVELDRFRYRQRSELRPVFMTNRMLEPHYNVACILRAFAIIQQSYPEASLVVAHDGHSKVSLEALKRELGLRHVDFIGRVPFEKIPELYDSADIYITTPDIDNVPGSILECFASGLPVIATRAGGIPYIAENRKTAMLVDLGDHRAVAACALELLRNPDLVIALTEQAAIEVRKYHWEPIRDQWARLYQDLVTGLGSGER